MIKNLFKVDLNQGGLAFDRVIFTPCSKIIFFRILIFLRQRVIYRYPLYR